MTMPVYSSNAPEVLSPTDLSVGLLSVFLRKAAKVTRMLVAVACWLLLVPYCTAQMWYLFFTKEVTEDEEYVTILLFNCD